MGNGKTKKLPLRELFRCIRSKDVLKSNALDVIGIGKIRDIFNGQGITKSIHSTSSHEGMLQTIEEMKKGKRNKAKE